MPTQSKNSLAITPSDRPAKPKKKKKKESGRKSRNTNSKTPASGADSSSEGTHRVKSRAKVRGGETDDEKKLKSAGDFSSKSRSSSTQNTSSSSWRTSSSDGRSTSSSGENFGAASCTKSPSTDESRVRESVNSLGQSSLTSLTRINETLRWDYTQCEDPDEEEERLRIYKLHRRKRYMDFLHKRTGEPSNSFYA